jgi:type II secretory pathway pseudopilin PulG
MSEIGSTPEIPEPGPKFRTEVSTKIGLSGCMTLLAVVGGILVVGALSLPTTRRGREAARRSQCKNNLKNIALALLTYEAEYHSLPPAYTVDADGKPLHSWRTLILPYLDQERLYSQIDLSRPWDDPANAEACASFPDAYSCPSAYERKGFTIYMANSAGNGCLRPGTGRPLSEITDESSNTLLAFEVPKDLAVHWMSPRDADEAHFLNFNADSELAHFKGGQAALCDGSVRFLSAALPIETRRALLSIAGGETIKEF